MSQKRKHPSDEEGDDFLPTIFRSEPIHDRESTFIGLFSPKLSAKELKALPEIKDASHNMQGWRRESNQQSLTSAKQYVTGHDDDGEKYGGKKVEQVLVSMRAAGTCVVARWYGGVMLGPVRFTHIEHCAKEAVKQYLDRVGEAQAKKRKIVEDAADKEKLVRTLGTRDQSITVLRVLAAEKEEAAKRAREPKQNGENGDALGQGVIYDATSNKSPPEKKSASQAPAIDYEAMPVERLRALEKARDATLSFLLKRIDKAEAELAQSSKDEKDEKPP